MLTCALLPTPSSTTSSTRPSCLSRDCYAVSLMDRIVTSSHHTRYEAMTPELFESGLRLTSDLDMLFGQPNRTVLSLRDVPGLTRAALPILAKYGVKAVSVGVNTFSGPPSVARIFKWRDVASDTELYGLWHRGGCVRAAHALYSYTPWCWCCVPELSCGYFHYHCAVFTILAAACRVRLWCTRPVNWQCSTRQPGHVKQRQHRPVWTL